MATRPELDPIITAKVGARLAYVEFLARTDLPELARLEAAETAELKGLEARIAQAQARLFQAKTEAQQERGREELRELHDRLFAPVTCGVHLPDAQGRTRTWPGGPNKPFVSAFITMKDVDEDEAKEELKRLGVTVRARTRSVVTALIPIASVRTVGLSTLVSSVELARPLFPNQDYTTGDAVQRAGILARHQGGMKGDNVIIGVIDDALDLAHPDFQVVDSTGVVRSRVLYYWQQDLEAPQGTATTPPPLPAYARSPGATYGVEYKKADIDGWLSGSTAVPFPKQPPPPESTHGTLVTGCAAGNGRAFAAFVKASGRPSVNGVAVTDVVGAAPNADIVFVARQAVGGTSLVADATAVCDAFAYVFARATDENKDCVVNLSHSDNLGPHDGTSAVESFLNGLLAGQSAGRTITLSAGNSNRTGHHATARLASGRAQTMHLNYSSMPSGSLPTRSDAVEIWYPGAERVSLTLSVPATATSAAVVLGPVPAPGTLTQVVGDVTVIIDSQVPGPRSTDNVISVMIVVAPGRSIPLGDWIFELQAGSANNVDLQAWVDRSNRGYSGWLTPALTVDDVTLANPSAAGEPITVGNHDAATPPVIQKNSGHGLTRSGGAKPDLAALGVWMLAPYPVSLSTNPAYPYAHGAGTSVAAPLVAGSCAILLQNKPHRTHTLIKAELLALATRLVPPQPQAFGTGYLTM